MKYVADDCDFETFNTALLFANRQRVQQRLSGMLVRAVAGVDDRRVAHPCQLLWRPIASSCVTRWPAMQSGAIASRLRAVSSNVSPLLTLEVETLMFTASAESRLAAISKEVRVRVDDSKKRLMTVRPRRAGTFLISRWEISRNVSAVSSRCVISPASSSRMPRRCLRLNCTVLMKSGFWS